MQVKYETEIKEMQIAALVKERKFTRLITISVGVILFMLLVSLFFIYLYTKQKHRKAKLQIKQLEQEKQLISTQAVLDGETQERIRLSRDLHDGLGSMLAAVKLNLNGMQHTQKLNEALRILDESIREMRRVAHNLMPESLSRYGLKTALSDFLNTIPATNFAFYGDCSVRLDSRLEVMIYRVIHELVNNALKHSSATHIYVQIVQETSRINFTVSDNGAGFDAEQQYSGSGLANIRARIASFGGNIEFHSEKNKGTEVICELKIENEK
jgi:signal transduction histidine kinase